MNNDQEELTMSETADQDMNADRPKRVRKPKSDLAVDKHEQIEAKPKKSRAKPKVEAKSDEQVAPTKNEHPAAWDLVIEDIKKFWGYSDAADNPIQSFINVIEKRDKLGAERYGVRLQPHNGRDTLRDAFEEALDGTVYLRSLYYELYTLKKGTTQHHRYETVKRLFHDQLMIAISLHELQQEIEKGKVAAAKHRTRFPGFRATT